MSEATDAPTHSGSYEPAGHFDDLKKAIELGTVPQDQVNSAAEAIRKQVYGTGTNVEIVSAAVGILKPLLTFLPILLLMLVMTSRSAFAWGKEGHIIVAAIAEEYLTDDAKAAILEILDEGLSISDDEVANYADHIRMSHPKTRPWHFIDIPFDATAIDPNRDCKNGDDVIDEIDRCVTVLKNHDATRDERAEALKFLVHCVGDCHQPLHCAERNGDRGGNSQACFFLVSRQLINLHKVWDSMILKKSMGTQDPPQYAEILCKQITPQIKASCEQGALLDWAWESHTVAIQHAYGDLPNGTAPRINAQYVATNAPIVDMQLMRGGIRLAKLLNEAFAR